MSGIADNLQQIQQRIREAAGGREIKLIGISKTVAAERIQEAFTAGVSIFGENRIQEALPKTRALQGLGIVWHFVGHLQSNKVKEAVENFSCIHSVDSIKLLHQIEKDCAKRQTTIEALLEVNLGGEESKHGFAEKDIEGALQAGANLQRVSISGLMVLPPYFEDREKVRPYFRRLRELRDRFSGRYPSLVELSMGMTHDYVVAIQEGATMIRIGTALFGPRRK
ncbi:MAG TPA: YggS family pyridoxal phosphate-dependent enzyme [Acidobacteriota bacterium]|nr:YggS family pyridoxal phosphate-dependent enzyme [Acidobacteriota bacterium]